MSDPPNTSSIILVDPHHPLLISTTATTTNTAPPSSSLSREYRKGNWTLHETLILITAKKMDDERRARSSTAESKQTCKTAELRWKWVENYCWNNGCFRSQNQCNDKWDNLLRDYKKVRDYENRPSPSSDANKDRPSYWKMEKHERKERNLPSNLIFDVFQALHEAVNRRYTQRSSAPDVSTAVIARSAAPPPPLLPPPPPPPPLSLPPPPQPQQSPVSVEMEDSSETEGSERADFDTKRRKVRIGASMVRSASVLARTLLACEDKRDKRHQDVMELEERKVQMEENRSELNRQGISGLITAVDNLSSAIYALVSDRNDTR